MSPFAPVISPPLTTLAAQLGLERAGGRWGPCPVCGATRGGRHDPRRGPLAIFGRGDAERWRCQAAGCDAGGGAVALLAAARLGCIPRRGDPRWGAIYRELGGDGAPRARRPVRPAADLRERTPEDPPSRYPPTDELDALWNASWRLDDPPGRPHSALDTAVDAFLRRRSFGPATALAALADVRVLPLPDAYAWPSWWPRRWSSAWRLALRAHTVNGTPASLHGRAVVDVSPKTRWPKGYEARGLLLADWAGELLLRGDRAVLAELEGILVVEGFTDVLRAALTVACAKCPLAVLGATSGGFAAVGQVNVPKALPIYVATDADPAGDRYAREVADAIFPRLARRLPLSLDGTPDVD